MWEKFILNLQKASNSFDSVRLDSLNHSISSSDRL
jgi:hypothetical protein